MSAHIEPSGFVRWATPDDEWAGPLTTAPEFRVAIVDELRASDGKWRLEDRQPGRPCRRTVGPGHALCKRPSVAVHDQSWSRRRNDWGYCELHLFGKHLEDGKLLATRWVAATAGAS